MARSIPEENKKKRKLSFDAVRSQLLSVFDKKKKKTLVRERTNDSLMGK